MGIMPGDSFSITCLVLLAIISRRVVVFTAYVIRMMEIFFLVKLLPVTLTLAALMTMT